MLEQPSAVEKAPELLQAADVVTQRKYGDLAELLASLDRQEITEEQFLEELGDLQDLDAENPDSSTVDTHGDRQALDKLEKEELEHVYGDAIDCS